MMLETPSAPPPPLTNPSSDPLPLPMEQDSSLALDLSSTQVQPIPHPAATSSPQQDSLSQDRETTASLDPDQESGPLLYLSESLQEELTTVGAERPACDSGEEISVAPLEQSQTTGTSNPDTRQKESVPGSVVEPLNADPGAAEPSAKQLAKPKKDKLAILRKLGLDPPPVAKLCPDGGAFIQLDPPQLNPGE